MLIVSILGLENIQKFVLEQLPSTEHTTSSLDAQPVLAEAVGGQQTIAVQVAGAVKYENKRSKPFQQNFLLTAVDGKWKIASQVFRHQEPSAASANQ